MNKTAKLKPIFSIGPEVLAADPPLTTYSTETVALFVISVALITLVIGIGMGYFCGKRCKKDEDDNMPYPDTEYEYFEQRQNINRFVDCLNFVATLCSFRWIYHFHLKVKQSSQKQPIQHFTNHSATLRVILIRNF